MTLLTILVLWVFKGSAVLLSLTEGTMMQGQDSTSLKWIQLGSSVGMFVLPPLLLGKIEKKLPEYVRQEGAMSPVLLVLVVAILVSFMPIMHWVIELNSQLHLPESWAAIEEWMHQKETEMERLTQLFLKDTQLSSLFLNLLVMAVVPAIGEELFFRGVIQKVAVDWFRNPHIAIWVVAILFSAIHLQFYGFFPRMLLGLLFGYLYFWSNQIWLPIFAHFVNNATVVIVAFYLQRQGLSLDDATIGQQIPVHLYAVCAVVTSFLLYQCWKMTHATNQLKNGEKLG